VTLLRRTCAVAERGCYAPANGPESKKIGACYQCGSDVCTNPACSRRKIYQGSIHRLCLSCIEQLPTLPPRKCAHCKTTFTPIRTNNRFCKPYCKAAKLKGHRLKKVGLTCKNPGCKVMFDQSRPRQRYCSEECRWEANNARRAPGPGQKGQAKRCSACGQIGHNRATCTDARVDRKNA
jgi:hypothetical protein